MEPGGWVTSESKFIFDSHHGRKKSLVELGRQKARDNKMYNISAVSNLVEHDKVLKKVKHSHQMFDAPVFSIDKSSKKATQMGSEASTYDK